MSSSDKATDDKVSETTLSTDLTDSKKRHSENGGCSELCFGAEAELSEK